MFRLERWKGALGLAWVGEEENVGPWKTLLVHD